KNEFLNKRKAKGEIAAPQSQSNLWFVEPDRLDEIGPVIGRGGVWADEDVPANTPSDPFLFAGFDRRGLHLTHEGEEAVTVTIEVDTEGDGLWKKLLEVRLAPKAYTWVAFKQDGAWIRLQSDSPLKKATAWFEFSNRDDRPRESHAMF